MLSGIFINLLLAIIIGGTIGLERESIDQSNNNIGGIRTYALISLTGAISGILALNNYVNFSLIITTAIVIIVVIYYFIGATATKNFGISSELSAILTYIIGFLLAVEIIPLEITVAIFVILMFILSIKSMTTQLVEGISRQELQSFISYAIITLVILPILPDTSYKVADIPVLPQIFTSLNIDLGKFATIDIINPRKIWFVVVLITGIDVFGYILGRLVGDKKGFALTSFIAGFISSTSATQSLAQRSKSTAFVNHLVGAAVLANLASFLQIFLLVGPLNPQWLLSIMPAILIMIMTAGIIAIILLKKEQPEENEENVEQSKPTKIFSLLPALRFAGLLVLVKIITKTCLILFGNSGFVISSVIASFAGIDAIMVNLAEMAGKSISFHFALLTFILVNATNLLSKTIYSFVLGNKRFAYRFMISAILIVAAGSLWLIFI
ncbi:MAG: MgtC/SapB family protein [Saprospiraceae bacterium]|nr:MgtC/SapB family protein [Saprospiraceae bacterium]